MFADDPSLIGAVRQWVAQAESALWLASLTLKHGGKRYPRDGACFHVPQCAEKYLKALLTWQGVAFPRTHELEELISRLSARNWPDLTAEEQRVISRYLTVTRYPGDYEPIALTEARLDVTLARRVRRQARRWLPRQAFWAQRWTSSTTP